jgi:CRP/FNR family transcriptional regulator
MCIFDVFYVFLAIHKNAIRQRSEMNTDQIKQRLGFLGSPLLEAIFQAGVFLEIHKGEILMHEGQYVKYLPLVLEGTVKVSIKQDEKELLLYYIKPYESCVMSLASCLQNEASRINAFVYENGSVLLLPSDKVREWSQQYPKLNILLLQQYDKRYSDLIDALHHVSFDKLEKRIMDYLLQKCAMDGSKKLKISHRELAMDLGTAREVVTRILKKLETGGFVRQGENYLEILKLGDKSHH